MKHRLITFALLFAALPAIAQTPTQVDLQKQAASLQARYEVVYNKLRDITEFQQFLGLQKEIEDYKAALQRANAAAVKPVPATPAPVVKK
jgi:hypothetical protein